MSFKKREAESGWGSGVPAPSRMSEAEAVAGDGGELVDEPLDDLVMEEEALVPGGVVPPGHSILPGLSPEWFDIPSPPELPVIYDPGGHFEPTLRDYAKRYAKRKANYLSLKRMQIAGYDVDPEHLEDVRMSLIMALHAYTKAGGTRI